MRNLLVSAAASFCALCCVTTAWAQLPRTISYQGILADSAGNFLPDGNHALTLTLYDAAAGGNVVFTETQSTVPVVRGVFNSILGSATAGGIPPGVLFDRAYFLGVKVDGGAELTPRTPLTASPYALHAAVADTVTVPPGAVAGQALTYDGTSLVYANPVLQLPYNGEYNTPQTLLSLKNDNTSGGGLSVTSSASSTPTLFTSNVGGGPAVQGFSAFGSTVAIQAENYGSGAGVIGTSASGVGVFGQAGNIGSSGTAGEFRNYDPANSNPVLYVTTISTTGVPLLVEAPGGFTAGNLAIFRTTSNKARIDATGKGFFNGGTQSSGADVAEAFETEGAASTYEPGDVLVISTQHNRTVERSAEPYSTRVAGVYATKPGVVLTDRTIDANLADTVPMGVIGVIPTKVSAEHGAIHRGDLLVTSSTPGHAMRVRAGDQPPAGAIIGKALEPFEGAGTGTINVLVSIR